MNNTNVRNLQFLDFFRALAAFYVMLGHSRWLLWEGYSSGYLLNGGNYSLLDKANMYLFLLTRWGHEAVIVFFVLSGFVIHLRYSSQLSKSQSEKFDFFPFFKRRIKRIYPPFIVAIVITFFFDFLGQSLGLSIYAGNTPYMTINQNIGSDISLMTLVGNLFFVAGKDIPIYGSNGALWSLSYEWWFYMIYPVFHWCSKKHVILSYSFTFLLLCFGFWGGYEENLAGSISKYFCIWSLGAFLADIYTGRIKIKFVYLIWLLAISPLIYFLTSVSGGFLGDFQVSLLIVGVFSTLFFVQEKGFQIPDFVLLKKLSHFSYSLYVVHMPLLVFLCGLLMKYNEGGFLPMHSWFIYLGIVLSVTLGYVVYLFAERPFLSKRK